VGILADPIDHSYTVVLPLPAPVDQGGLVYSAEPALVFSATATTTTMNAATPTPMAMAASKREGTASMNERSKRAATATARAVSKNAIPRPRNSWILYRQDRTRDLRAHDPSLTASEISRIVSSLWKDELPHVKTYYTELAATEAQAHRDNHPDYRYRARRPVNRYSTDSAAFWESLGGSTGS
jgi:hypothetical protein